MAIILRKARKSDMKAVLNLIQELAHFEREPDAVEIDEKKLMKDGFEDQAAFQCFVAEEDDHIVGMALVYMRYSTWKGPSLHLEDLIVSANSRNKGIGSDLLDEVVKYGKELGVKRISWEVLDWNEDAIRFYERKGAVVLRDWNVVQLNEAAIDNYLKEIDS